MNQVECFFIVCELIIGFHSLFEKIQYLFNSLVFRFNKAILQGSGHSPGREAEIDRWNIIYGNYVGNEM